LLVVVAVAAGVAVVAPVVTGYPYQANYLALIHLQNHRLY
jgi:hypothetical protein